mgnify:CR=1 FL=1
MTTKRTCGKCNQTKALTEFKKSKSCSLGRSFTCIECTKAYNIAYREKNRERLLQADRKRYAENAEEMKAKSAEHKAKNKDYYLIYNRHYYRLNKYKFLAYNSKRRKVIEKSTPDWLSQEHKDQIADQYWLAQDLAAVSGETYHVDHIVPLQGKDVCGLHVPWNLQILPADLNLQKGNRHESY